MMNLFCKWLLLIVVGTYCFLAADAKTHLANWNMYHKTEVIHQEVERLVAANPAIAKDHIDPQSKDHVVLISNHVHNIKPDTKKLKMYLVFGEHGREPISSEIGLELLYFLLGEFKDAENNLRPSLAGQTLKVPNPELVEFILDNVVFIIIPVISIWSREQVEQGEECLRKNENNVDLNRNWDYLWAQSPKKAGRQASDFPGPEPFSETQSRFMRDVGKKWLPDVYINAHSGITEMYCGWDSKPDLIPNYQDVHAVLEFVNKRSVNCPTGGAGAIGGYFVYGSSMDYLYTEYNVTYALTTEVYGGSEKFTKNQCFAFFNPLEQDDYEITVNIWALSYFHFALKILEDYKGISYPLSTKAIIPAVVLTHPKGKRENKPIIPLTDAESDALVYPHYSPLSKLLTVPLMEDIRLIPNVKQVTMHPKSVYGAICLQIDVVRGLTVDKTNDKNAAEKTVAKMMLLGGLSWNDYYSSNVIYSSIMDIASGALGFGTNEHISELQVFVMTQLVEPINGKFCESHVFEHEKKTRGLEAQALSANIPSMIDKIQPDYVVTLRARERASGQASVGDLHFLTLRSSSTEHNSQLAAVLRNVNALTSVTWLNDDDLHFSDIPVLSEIEQAISNLHKETTPILMDITFAGWGPRQEHSLQECDFFEINPPYKMIKKVAPQMGKLVHSGLTLLDGAKLDAPERRKLPSIQARVKELEEEPSLSNKVAYVIAALICIVGIFSWWRRRKVHRGLKSLSNLANNV